jgi:hypothetical protein
VGLRAVEPDLKLAVASGGTDVCTAFVGGVPLLPVYSGEITCRAWARPSTRSARRHPRRSGELGELVITKPMPSMPVGFWNDPDGSRYREAYFDTFPGVWRHGDWLTITERGTLVITGRSDATLNRGGVRLGTAEFYSVVEGFPEVADSLVVHLEDPHGGPGELILFVVPAAGVTVDDDLRSRIAKELRGALSPRHVPDTLHSVSAVPRTLSGKKLEVPVKRILGGMPADRAAAKGALANPESLTEFEALAGEGHKATARSAARGSRAPVLIKVFTVDDRSAGRQRRQQPVDGVRVPTASMSTRPRPGCRVPRPARRPGQPARRVFTAERRLGGSHGRAGEVVAVPAHSAHVVQPSRPASPRGSAGPSVPGRAGNRSVAADSTGDAAEDHRAVR